MYQLIESIRDRQKMLSPELVKLQDEIREAYDKNIGDAGVITPGYFDSFYPILENYRFNGIISKYMIYEEEYVNGGRLLKIPVIDLSLKNQHSSTRLFILPKNVLDRI